MTSRGNQAVCAAVGFPMAHAVFLSQYRDSQVERPGFRVGSFTWISKRLDPSIALSFPSSWATLIDTCDWEA